MRFSVVILLAFIATATAIPAPWTWTGVYDTAKSTAWSLYDSAKSVASSKAKAAYYDAKAIIIELADKAGYDLSDSIESLESRAAQFSDDIVKPALVNAKAKIQQLIENSDPIIKDLLESANIQFDKLKAQIQESYENFNVDNVSENLNSLLEGGLAKAVGNAKTCLTQFRPAVKEYAGKYWEQIEPCASQAKESSADIIQEVQVLVGKVPKIVNSVVSTIDGCVTTKAEGALKTATCVNSVVNVAANLNVITDAMALRTKAEIALVKAGVQFALCTAVIASPAISEASALSKQIQACLTQ